MSTYQITLLTRKPGPYPAGRVCAHKNCTTILHRFHEGDECYLHAPIEEASEAERRESLQDIWTELMAA